MGEKDFIGAIGAYKGVADFVAAGTAAVIAMVGVNALGLVNQCPEATVTILGVTITLKALLQFLNNYRKHR